MNEYKIKIIKDDDRFSDVIFTTEGNFIRIPLEFNDTAILDNPKWTNSGQPMSFNQYQEICELIRAWGKKNSLNITFSRGISKEESMKDYLSKGYQVIEHSDRSVTYIPPSKK